MNFETLIILASYEKTRYFSIKLNLNMKVPTKSVIPKYISNHYEIGSVYFQKCCFQISYCSRLFTQKTIVRYNLIFMFCLRHVFRYGNVVYKTVRNRVHKIIIIWGNVVPILYCYVYK